VAQAVYPDLAIPPEMEAPPTFKQYPSSAITQTILGGRGRGLNCSIPWLGRGLFESQSETADVSLHFRPACAMHDLCYRHGYATYGYAQADCDRALQTSAFRMCTQINALKPGKDKVFRSCQTEAKKVLLGVSIGGAGSFQAAGKSTYFEYDPMPEQANNYVIGRAYPLTPQQSAKGELGIVTFHFWRNAVRARVLRVDPSNPSRLIDTRSEFVPYPGQYLPTAPTFESTGNNTPSLIALARMTFSDTRLAPVGFSTTTAGSNTSLAMTLCPSPLNNTQCARDMDTAINRLANVEHRPMLVSIRHRASIKRNTNAGDRIPTVVLTRLDLGENRKIDDYPLNGSAAINDGYRFLQNDLLLEKDADGADTHAWILVRGMALDPETRLITANPDATGYQDHLLVIRQPLADGQGGNTQRFMIDASETDDPLALVRLRKGSGVALVGLRWNSDDLKKVEASKESERPPSLSVWRLPEAATLPPTGLIKSAPLSLGSPLLNGFIERPPVLVDAPGFTSPVFVWTRIITDPQTPEKLSSDILLTTLDSTSDHNQPPVLTEVGSFRCNLDLKKQIQAAEASMIRQFANRAQGAGSETVLTPSTERAGIADLTKRWQMSQTVVSSRPSEASQTDDLTITTIFNGYPGMSFQVLLNSIEGRFRYSHALPASTYINCDNRQEAVTER